MWILTPVRPGGETHYLFSGKEYVVGRKNCNIILPSDQSVSRAHAHLSAADQTLTLKDTSKYGTFVNGTPQKEPVTLKSGDAVTFGVFESKFSVDHLMPVVSSSCLDVDAKASLAQSLSAFGGKVVNSWTEDCTHLVMSSVKVTIKTISALLCCRPIVKPDFFSELHRAAQQKLPPPKAESFVPELDEPSLDKQQVKLEVISGRKRLFKGKTFVFLSAKQLKRLSAAVGFGGGTCHQLEEGSLPRVLLESPQSCVIDLSTAASQTLLSASTAEWATSVKSFVQRSGLRVITESKIGLAAIYASCDNYCNPSRPTGESGSLTKVHPTIPASLSQSAAVDETVLPAASQNITAYAVNTEASQRVGFCGGTQMVTVAETPEKKESQNTAPPRFPSAAQKTNTLCVVADTMSSSMNSPEHISAHRPKPDSRVPGGESGELRRQPSALKTNRGANSFFSKRSPQKQRSSSQASPQKQSTLTSFFQSVNKKRPLDDDDSSAVMSEPKRPALQASIAAQASSPSGSFKHDTAADLFKRQSENIAKEPQSKNVKEEAEEIHMEELESLMSMDMDCFDEPLPEESIRQQQVFTGATKHKQGSRSEEFGSSSKRQKTQQEESDSTRRRPPVGVPEESSSQKNRGKQPPVSVESGHHRVTDVTATARSEPPQKSSSFTNKNITSFEDDNDASFIEVRTDDLFLVSQTLTLSPGKMTAAARKNDSDMLQAENTLPQEELKPPVEPVQLQQEVQKSNIDRDLPEKLVLVEFRSLAVAAPPKHKPTAQTQSSGSLKNFKRFRKGGASKACTHVIAGSDLLAHNRDKNSDMDEWLKDVVEEELQKKRDESVGDDLFRYNPTKLTKRR